MCPTNKDNFHFQKFSQLRLQLKDDMFPCKNPFLALADGSDDDSQLSNSPRVLDHEEGELAEIFGDLGVKDTDGGEELFEMEFKQNKRAYYIEKFDVPVADG